MSGEVVAFTLSDLGEQHSIGFQGYEYLHCRAECHLEEHRRHRVLGRGSQGVLLKTGGSS